MKSIKLISILLFILNLNGSVYFNPIVINNIGSQNTILEDYYMIINIPKIKLYKDINKIDSIYNTVDYGIELLYEEDNLIVLASHRGNGYIAYFNNLYKLDNNDIVRLCVGKIWKEYKVVDKYYIKKNGKATIKRNKEKDTLALITCVKNHPKIQVVYICESS
jgi:LPXTG-site transpeptidase (sortase) family protein